MQSIEAFVAAIANKEIYDRFALYVDFDSSEFSYDSFNLEKLMLLCKAIENHPKPLSIVLFDITIDNIINFATRVSTTLKSF